MSHKKNSTRAHSYDKEFPSLSDINSNDNNGSLVESLTYSARLKAVSQPRLPVKKEDNGNVNKEIHISSLNLSKVPDGRSKSGKIQSTQDKKMPYNSPTKSFDRVNSISKNSITHSSLGEGDCSETKDDANKAWTVVKKKRVCQEYSSQNKNEFSADCAPINVSINGKVNFESKNNVRQRDNKKIKNEYSDKKSLSSNKDQFRFKESNKNSSLCSNKDQFRFKDSNKNSSLSSNSNKFQFKDSFSDTPSFKSQSFLMVNKDDNVTQSKSKADLKNNVNFGNNQEKTSARRVSHQKNFISGNFKENYSEKHDWNKESKKNVPKLLKKQSLSKEHSFTSTKDDTQPLNKCSLKSTASYSDSSYMKSNSKPFHKRPHMTVPENKQTSHSNHSAVMNVQNNPSKAELSPLKLEKTSKKKRKSKLKRQAGLQRDKVQLISSNVFDKILKLNSESNVQTQRNVTINIHDESEYPELGAKSDGGKQYFYSEVVHADNEVEVKNEEICACGSPSKSFLLPTGGDKKNTLSDQEEGTSETEKLALRHNDPITISLFDIITNKTKKKNTEKNNKFFFGVPTSTAKGKRSAILSGKSQNINPLDSSKPAIKRGKEREKPKLKKPSHLKRIILLDRKKRKEQIRSYKDELFEKEEVDDLNTQSATLFNSVNSILTSPPENLPQCYSDIFEEKISSSSMQTVSNIDNSELLYVESFKESSNNNFVLHENCDFNEGFTNVEGDASCIKSYLCDPKNDTLPVKDNASGIQNNLDSKCHASLETNDTSFLQKSCHSNNQLVESDSSFNEIIIDVRWLFSLSRQCVHKVSWGKCFTCTDFQSFDNNVSCNRNQKNVLKCKKVQMLPNDDALLYSLRYLFHTNSSSELMCTEHILSDIRYLFIEECCFSMFSDENLSTINPSNYQFDENNLSVGISDKLEIVNNNLLIDVNNKNSSINVIDSSNFNSKVNMLTCDTNLELTDSSYDKTELMPIEIEETKTNVCQIENEIPILGSLVPESIPSKISKKNSICFDYLESVDEKSPNRKFSEKEIKQASLIILHSKKFREYCDQFLCKALDETVSLLLDDLARFQDRMHQKDPVKARMKRRLVYGIREIKRNLKLKKLKCIIIASDIEDSRSEGGLNDNLDELKSFAKDFQIPCVYSHTRRLLGKRCRKSAPVSAVGIFNYEGSEENFKKMLILQRDCKLDYAFVVKLLSSKLTDNQVELLCLTKEENPANLFNVTMKLLKEYFPPTKLTDNASESDTKDLLGSSENGTYKDENVAMYNILVKYKIVNY